MVPCATHAVVSAALRRLALKSLIACLPIALVAAPVSAGTFTVFGPHSYQRGTGRPVTERAAFSVLNPSIPYLLRIHVDGVASAVISLNGTIIVDPSQFNERATLVETTIALALVNELALQLGAGPDGRIAGEIIGTDNDPPLITAAATPTANSNGWNNRDVVVSFTCSDTTSGIATCPLPVSVAREVANQVISGTAVDKAGNTAATNSTAKIDKTAPTFTITSPTGGSTVFTSEAVIAGIVRDSLSGLAAVTCNGVPATVVGTLVQCGVTLTPGSNSISAIATDAAGNSSTVRLSVTFVRVPKVTIASPANLSYLNISPTTVTGTVDDPTATVTINSVPATVAGGGFSVGLPLAEGPNIITATATTASAIGPTSLEVTLDTTPPHVTIISPADGFVTTDASISVAGNVNDIVVGTVNNQQAHVTVNGADADVANRMFLATAVPLALGANVLRAVGTDRVGNAATTQITVIRQTPTTLPKIQVVAGNNQTGTIGNVLAAPLVVAVTGSPGSPFSNKPVIFKVTKNDGIVASGVAPAPTAIVNTDAQGQARVQWTLGMRAGAGGNSVEAYSVGFEGTAIFTATGTLGQAGKVVIDTGNDQIGLIGEPLPKAFIAVVVDGGNNRLAGIPVTFTVQQGGGTIDGQPSVTVNTDSDGRVAATLTLGPHEGNANNLVEVNFLSNQGFPAAFSASGRAPGEPMKTTISGVVLDNSNNPIPGVTLRAVLTN